MADKASKDAFSFLCMVVVSLLLLPKSGILRIILLSRSISKVAAHKCNPLIINNYWGLNCSAKGITEIPQDLDSSIEILFARNSSFDRLNVSSFARYKNLVFIDLRSTNYSFTTNPIDSNTFWELENLEKLDLDNIGTPFNLKFNWPEKINEISLHGNQFIEHIDLSSVKKLNFFDASSCSLRSFPKFDRFVPLKELDLTLNSALNITLENVAQFCLLETIGLPFTFNDSLKHCEFRRILQWLGNFNIKLNIDVGAQVLKDFLSSISKDNTCDMNFSVLLERREECLKFQKPVLFSTWFLVSVVLVLLTPFIIMAFWYTERRQKVLKREMHYSKTLSSSEVEENDADHESDHDHREISMMRGTF